MSNKEWIKLIKENEETIIDKIIECDKWNAKFQYDILFYRDGDVYAFPNPGGNSFKSGKYEKYITICSINNEYNEENKEEIDTNDYVDFAKWKISNTIECLENEY